MSFICSESSSQNPADALTSSPGTCGAYGFLGTQFGNLWLATLPMAFLVCVMAGPAMDPDEVQQTGSQLGSCGQMFLPGSPRKPAEAVHKGLAL